MKKVIRLNENDIENLVKKILKEDNRPRGGILYGGRSEMIDEIVNRINEYGEEYTQELIKLNNRFPSTKYTKINPPTSVELPKGVKVRSTVYPNK